MYYPVYRVFRIIRKYDFCGWTILYYRIGLGYIGNLFHCKLLKVNAGNPFLDRSDVQVGRQRHTLPCIATDIFRQHIFRSSDYLLYGWIVIFTQVHKIQLQGTGIEDDCACTSKDPIFAPRFSKLGRRV